MKKWQLALAGLGALIIGITLSWSMKADFVTLDGQSHQWRELKGKWVVVSYFASWCAPCLKEVPELNDFYQKNQQTAMYAVSFDQLAPPELTSLRDTYAITYPIIQRLDSALWSQRPKSLPHTIIIDPQGRVVKQLVGEQSAQSLASNLAQLQGL